MDKLKNEANNDNIVINHLQIMPDCYKSLDEFIYLINQRIKTVENQPGISSEISKCVTNPDNHESMPNQPNKQSNNDDERFSLYLSAKEGKVKSVQGVIIKFILIKRSRYLKDKKMLNFFTELKTELKKKTLKFLNSKKKGSGFNALHLAACHGQTEVVEYLIKIGANIDEKDEVNGNTPLILAIKYGQTNNEAMTLNENEANLRIKNNNDLTAMTLIKNKANLTIKDNNDSTALHYASRYGNAIIVSTIFETLKEDNLKKIDVVSAADNNKATPLHLAQYGGNKIVVYHLIKYGAKLFTTDNKERMPIHYLAESEAYKDNDTKNKKDLLDILYDACESIDNKTKLLNSKTIEKYTPLHIAVIYGNEKCVNKLISLGADVNSMDNKLMTPIHLACQFGKLPIVKILVENGASLDVKNKNDYTPFMCAHHKNHVNVVEYLNSRDNSSNANHLNHITPQLNPLNMLKNYTPRNSIVADEGHVLSSASLNNKDPDIGKIHEKSPLHFAAERGDLIEVEKLITSVNVNLTDFDGRTPLHLAALNNRG